MIIVGMLSSRVPLQEAIWRVDFVRKYNPVVRGTDEDVAKCDKDGMQFGFSK